LKNTALLAKAHAGGNPVIAGDEATFVWQGRTAPRLVDDMHNWEDNPQTMLRAGPGLWSYPVRLAGDAYLEYGFLDPKNGERLADPLNRKRVWNGNSYNHYFYMPHAGPSPLVEPLEGVPQGTVARFQVPTRDSVSGTNRTVYLYQPPVRQPVPLLVVYDGSDYLKRAKLNVITDNLIADKRVRPFAMALINSGGQARNLEYSCSESTLEFLTEVVIPFARENLNILSPGRGTYGVAGASLGGLMALFTGLRLPTLFGKVLSQSGAFTFPDRESLVTDLIRYVPSQKLNIWMEAGKYEWLLEGNRQMVALLKKKSYNVKYHEFSGGHNYTSWRNEIWRGLEILFRN
jgi:enterochelin esterase-like enzyme